MPPARAYTSRVLFGRFWRSYLRPYLPVMLIAFLVMMIEGSTLGLLSYMLEPLFDRVFAKGGSHALAWVGGAILALFIIRAITSIISSGMIGAVQVTVAFLT